MIICMTYAAGTCWSSMVRNDRCTEVLYENATKEECCSGAQSDTGIAWSSKHLDSGSLFFWRVLGGGVECKPCKDNCEGVLCGTDKTCVMRKGRPRCVCAPKCKDNSKKKQGKGTVCGTDGRTYKNVCRLRKRACRKRATDLTVAYYGICQNSCDKISCPSGKHCLLDQNLSPHCVRCLKKCPGALPARRRVCGSDGLTYASVCHLREKACRRGKAVPMAYRGPCRAPGSGGATCSRIRCPGTQTCLTDAKTGAPRCVTCVHRCKPRHMSGPICGTNNYTYPSWCHMMQDACQRGYIVETQHSGQCTNEVHLF
ncbi:follistatin isoform X2 [Onthophagus taurus]|uniref:follistatin isoform X2 n=1 Tax=Onthophagus taurus TaxID=166361 RepID=UPI0039BE85DF